MAKYIQVVPVSGYVAVFKNKDGLTRKERVTLIGLDETGCLIPLILMRGGYLDSPEACMENFDYQYIEDIER